MPRALTAVMWLAMAGVLAAQSPASTDVRVILSEPSANIVFAEFQGLPISLRPFSGAAIITAAEILFATKKDEISYLVLRLEGPTNEGGGNGYCGAGHEENLVWIKLSHAAVLDVRSVRFSSCAFSIDPLDGPRPTPDGLTIQFQSYSEGRKYVCSYDSAAPERGLSVVSTKLDP